MRPEKRFFGEQSMVLVFSVNRYLVPQKREKPFFDKRVFRYSAIGLHEKRENRLFRER
jgi:hypothetical protein